MHRQRTDPERLDRPGGVSLGGECGDMRSLPVEDPAVKHILESFALSTGLMVSLENLRPAIDGHGPPCERMSRMGAKRIGGCEARRTLLMDRVAATCGPASVKCRFGAFCLAVPVCVHGCHAATLRAGGFTRKTGTSRLRADAIRDFLLLAAEEVERRMVLRTEFLPSGGAALNRALAYIHGHFADPIRLAQIAGEAGVCRQHLSRIWRKHMGLPLNAYLHALRIERACVLLRTPGKKIITAAFECGFGSVSQFNRVFLRLRGIPPREFILRQALRHLGR